MPRTTRRELLIALNAAPALPRPPPHRRPQDVARCPPARPPPYRLAQERDRWSASGSPPDALAAEAGVPRAQMRKALAVIETAADTAAREAAGAERLGGRIATLADDGYPPGLRQLSPPPPVLYVRG